MTNTIKVRLLPGKDEYSEDEAARALGVTSAQFRSLLLRHLVEEDAMNNVPLMRFRPSDLLLLSVLDHTSGIGN